MNETLKKVCMISMIEKLRKCCTIFYLMKLWNKTSNSTYNIYPLCKFPLELQTKIVAEKETWKIWKS